MILCDVNVVLYAFRKDAVDHSRYRAWLEEVVNGAGVPLPWLDFSWHWR